MYFLNRNDSCSFREIYMLDIVGRKIKYTSECEMCLMSSHPKVPIAEETPKYRNVFMKSNVQSFPA